MQKKLLLNVYAFKHKIKKKKQQKKKKHVIWNKNIRKQKSDWTIMNI